MPRLCISITVFWLSFCIAGCNTTPVYQPPASADTAKLSFTSPYYKRAFLESGRLLLFIYHQDADCEITLEGKIPLSPKTGPLKFTTVAAGKALYVKVVQTNADYLSQTNSRRGAFFALVPETDGVYEIRHIDNPATIRIEAYALDELGNARSIELEDWGGCPKGGS